MPEPQDLDSAMAQFGGRATQAPQGGSDFRMGITGGGRQTTPMQMPPAPAPVSSGGLDAAMAQFGGKPVQAPAPVQPPVPPREKSWMRGDTTPLDENAPIGDIAKGFAQNVGASGVNFAKGVADTVMHPQQTAESIGAIPVGLYEKMGGPTPQGWDDAKGGGKQSAQMLDAMLDHFKNKYGGLEQVKKALYEDPV